MDDAEVADLATRVEEAIEHAAVGTVVTVLRDGAIVTDGPREVRRNWKWPGGSLAAFVVTHRRPSTFTIRKRIEQGLQKLERWQHPVDERGRYVPPFPGQMPEPDGETEILAYETTSEGTLISPAFPDSPEGWARW